MPDEEEQGKQREKEFASPALLLTRAYRFRRFSFAALTLLAISSVATISMAFLQILTKELFEHFSLASKDRVNSPEIKHREKPNLREEIRKAQLEMRATSSVREMESQTGIDLKEPTALPAGFVLKQVISPFAGIVTLVYEGPQNRAEVLITQQRIDAKVPVVSPLLFTSEEKDSGVSESPSPRSIWSKQPIFSNDPAFGRSGSSPAGASTKIESVQIGNVTGEYLQGGWEPTFKQVTLQGANSTNNTQTQQLQWKEGNVLFQISSPSELSKEELVAIAKSLR